MDHVLGLDMFSKPAWKARNPGIISDSDKNFPFLVIKVSKTNVI